MKKILSIIAIAAVAALGMSFSSCTRLEPTEIDNSMYPIKGKCEIKVTKDGSACGADLYITVTDSKSGKAYDVVRKANAATGVYVLDVPCTTSGAGVSITARFVVGTEYYSGSTSASLSSTNAWHTVTTVTVSKK
ncbi:MAG: hypothetical protein MJZ07_08215 [Bacteroidales bacterium]|nr:hypothetical protein [Bacteroidales bacterium]